MNIEVKSNNMAIGTYFEKPTLVLVKPIDGAVLQTSKGTAGAAASKVKATANAANRTCVWRASKWNNYQLWNCVIDMRKSRVSLK